MSSDYPISKRYQLISGHHQIAGKLILRKLLEQALLKDERRN